MKAYYLPFKNCSHFSIIFLQLLFLIIYGHHILDYFFLFLVYLINLRLKLVKNNNNNSKNIEKLEHMEYICDKKIHIYFKTMVMVAIFGRIFYMVNDIDVHRSNLGPFRSLNILNETLLKICVFWHFKTINA